MFCCVCPRDIMIAIGNCIIEASMSKRGRFFEYLPYRDIIYKLWDNDQSMKWKAAPKPSMDPGMYWEGYWDKFKNFDTKSKEEQDELLHNYNYVLNESEIAFDAVDISRFGKDIFIQHSKTTNIRAVEWLRRELEGYVKVHVLNFPYDKEPSHIDCTFVPLRPPRNNQKGLMLTNPERPLLAKDIKFFKNNNWELVDVPMPNKINYPMPNFCQSSKWLSMNLLSIDENTLVIEQSEKELHDFL